MEQHGTDGRGARRGRPGHAGSCSFSGSGTNSGKRMRPLGSAYRSRAKLGWAGSRGPGIFRSWRYAGKERAWKDVGHRPPRVPGLFLMVMRSGAERPRGCGVLPPPLAQALGRAFAEQTKPAGRYDRRNESLSYVGSGKGRWGGGGIPGRGWGPLIS